MKNKERLDLFEKELDALCEVYNINCSFETPTFGTDMIRRNSECVIITLFLVNDFELWLEEDWENDK